MGRYTDLLYARPSFLEGMARVADISGTLQVYNESPTPELSDYRALRSDWQQVGEDMQRAMTKCTADINARPSRGRRR